MPETELHTIRDVLTELDEIIELTVEDNSPLLIFAFVYRQTTAKIAAGIQNGRFENAARMEDFDVNFAKRYIDAYWQYREGKPVAFSWEIAFQAAEDSNGADLIILQHLLLGMNAHINLDLGIAAANSVPGDQINSLKHDFMKVNDLLEELIDEMQQRISRVSPLMFLLDWIGQRDDEAIINFSITKARDFAWQLAQRLAHSDEEEQENVIRRTDEHIAGLAKLIAYPPGFLIPKVLSVIRFFEEKDNSVLIEKLNS